MDPQHEESKVNNNGEEVIAQQREDPMEIPDILQVLELFPDQEPAVLYDIYLQVGRDKDLLIATILNDGQLPEEVQNNIAANDIQRNEYEAAGQDQESS